jgi:superfamily II DNA or RNA helicase
MAAGLGKTVLAAFDLVRLEAELGQPLRLLYVSERNAILDQAQRTFRRVLGPDRSYGLFHGQCHESEAELLFANFASLHSELGRFRPDDFSMIVVDEAHHTAAPTYAAVLDFFRPKWRLGLTATPFRGDGRDVPALYDDEVPACLPLERALATALLCPIDYRVFADLEPPQLERTLGLAARGHRARPWAERNNRQIVETVMTEAVGPAGDRRVVVFCASLKQMRLFAELFPSCRTICGSDGPRRQAEVLDCFRAGEFEVLLSRDVVNEGVDLPEASTLVFLRNTASPVVFLQQLGRGLRRHPGKNRVKVLDFVDNSERIEFVYAFYSRLESEIERRRQEGQPAPEASLELDQQSRDVIRALIAKKRRAGLVVDLAGLQGALDYAVGIKTLRRLIAEGRLVPDFLDPDGRDPLFELSSAQSFLRRAFAPSDPPGLVSDREVARITGIPLRSIQRRVERDQLTAAWLYHAHASYTELFFSASDLKLLSQ